MKASPKQMSIGPACEFDHAGVQAVKEHGKCS